MTHDPVMHALIDLCQQITKAPVLSEEMKVAYARALDVIRENVSPGGERDRYVQGSAFDPSAPVHQVKYSLEQVEDAMKDAARYRAQREDSFMEYYPDVEKAHLRPSFYEACDQLADRAVARCGARISVDR